MLLDLDLKEGGALCTRKNRGSASRPAERIHHTWCQSRLLGL